MQSAFLGRSLLLLHGPHGGWTTARFPRARRRRGRTQRIVRGSSTARGFRIGATAHGASRRAGPTGHRLALGRLSRGRSRRRHGDHRRAGVQARVRLRHLGQPAIADPDPGGDGDPAAGHRCVPPGRTVGGADHHLEGLARVRRDRHRHRHGAHRPPRHLRTAVASRSCSPTAPRQPRRSPPQTRRSTSPR